MRIQGCVTDRFHSGREGVEREEGLPQLPQPGVHSSIRTGGGGGGGGEGGGGGSGGGRNSTVGYYCCPAGFCVSY